MPAQRLGESFQSQKALRLQIFPDGGAADSFRYVAPVFLLRRATPRAKIDEDLIHCETPEDSSQSACCPVTAPGPQLGDGRPPWPSLD